MLIYDVRHDWPKKAGYILDRPEGRPHYIFAHYYTDVSLKCGDAFYEIPTGGCIFIEPGLAHRITCREELIHNWIHLGPEAEELIHRYEIPLNTPLYPHGHEALSDIFWKMETEFYSDNPFRDDMMENYVRNFLIWLHRAILDKSSSQTFSPETIRKMVAARKTILSASERRWTLAEMAQLIPFSPSRVHSIYKTLFGTTPNKDLIDIRVSLAKSLLRTRPEITLVEAAEMLGYNDQYHFIRQFKSFTGISPGKYRKSNR